MRNDKKNIDLLFREKLKGFRTKSPPQAWERLERDMDAVARKKKMFYFRLVAASLLVLLAFGAGYFYATFYSSGTFITKNARSVPEIIHEQETITQSPVTESSETVPEKQPSYSPESISMKDEGEITEESLQAGDVSLLSAGYKPEEVARLQSGPKLTELAQLNISQLDVREAFSGYSNLIISSDETDKTNKEIIDPSGYLYPFSLHDDDPLPATDAGQLKWKIGALLAPTYSYREISTNYEHSGIGGTDHTDALNTAEEALWSFSGGVNVHLRTGKRWEFQSGLYYARIGQINRDALRFELVNNEYQLVAINTSTGFIDIAYERVPDDVKNISFPKDEIEPLPIDNISLIQQFDLFEVPLLIRYRLIDTRFFINLAGGLSPAYLIKNHTWLEVEGEKHDVGLAPNLNSVIVNSSVGIGVGYDLSARLSFHFEPTFRYALNPINRNSEVHYHPYYLSWFTGFSYNF
jgi:hypothetical protein